MNVKQSRLLCAIIFVPAVIFGGPGNDLLDTANINDTAASSKQEIKK